ncbi:MAG: hypothetical protein ABEK36_04590 [Candidatus Aenigmatarchaeota archaeon]
MIEFDSERDFKKQLGRSLKLFNCDVFLDENIVDDLPVFHGTRERPDILVFFKGCKKTNKQISIKSPLALELKNISKTNKFSNISKSVLQIDKYFQNEYYTDDWKGKIKNIALATPHSIFEEYAYKWVNGNEEFDKGIDWTLRRILWTISNKAGILKRKNKGNYYLEYHNSKFFLDRDGIFKSKYNLGGYNH